MENVSKETDKYYFSHDLFLTKKKCTKDTYKIENEESLSIENECPFNIEIQRVFFHLITVALATMCHFMDQNLNLRL